MHVREIKAIAREKGLDPKKMKKAELIRAIQEKEGNTPCFDTGRDSCDQDACSWSGDCMQ